MAKQTYIALLRGINVGGNNKLPMKDLTAIIEKLGGTKVQTYIQSGNAVFQAETALAPKLPELIQKGILKSNKIEVPVIVRSAAELGKIAVAHPHNAAGVEFKALHVGFLAHKPSPAQVASLDPQRSPADIFSVKGSEIYILFGMDGVAKSKLTNQYMDSKLGTTSTLRNWNTVLKLNEMATQA
jgi:uncharacterized protein (DUF1697 family)